MKYIYYVLLATGLIVLLVRWPRVDKPLKLFAPLLAFAILTELIFDYTQQSYVYHIYQGCECVLLCTYYFLILQHSRYRWLILLTPILYLGYFTAFFIRFPEQFLNYAMMDSMAEDVFIALFSLYYLIDLYRNTQHIEFTRHPHFWIASGNLVYYSGVSLFMGLAFTLMTQNTHWYRQLSIIVRFLNLVLYITYIKAFLCRSQEKALA